MVGVGGIDRDPADEAPRLRAGVDPCEGDGRRRRAGVLRHEHPAAPGRRPERLRVALRALGGDDVAGAFVGSRPAVRSPARAARAAPSLRTRP